MGIRVANAPCSWGALEFDLEEAAGACGPAATYRTMLKELRAAGYDGTELGDWGFMPTDPTALAQALGETELVGAFVPVALANEEAHANGVSDALRVARLLAAINPDAHVVLADDNGTVPQRTRSAGRVRPGEGLDAAQWATFSAGAERIAAAVREDAGLRTVFHPHCAGWVETPAEIAELMQRTDPDLIGLCWDPGHIAFGGGDPISILETYGGRIWHVHFKDFALEIGRQSAAQGWDYFESVGNGVFCELGTGVVDFPAALAILRRLGYEGWIVVEQDMLPGMGAPFEQAKRNRAYLRGLGL